MALHGSVSANLSPILFKGNNRALGVNVLIHQDQSGSMLNIVAFYRDGSFIEELQNQLLNEKIGSDLESYPNLYSFFDTYSRNPSSAFTITNPRGSLTINQSFISGQSTGSLTRNLWTNYIVNISNHFVNICTDVAGTTTGGRLRSVVNAYAGATSEDVHGNLWSIFTTPNAISTGTPGRFGSVIGSSVRQGSVTVVITNSNEQSDFWDFTDDMINNSVVVSGGLQRTINGQTGEMVFRNYKIISLSSYFSTDGYDGILFYGSTSTQPYGYVTFTGATTYTITKSANAPNGWVFADTAGNIAPTGNLQQAQNTLLLASETKGALFKINRIFNTGTTDRRVAFSRCLAEFIADTV